MNGAAVKAYSLALDGGKQVAPHFRVREFACHDGTDTVFIAPALAEVLEQTRVHFGRPVVINSGYRTETWNKEQGGAARSQHKYGTAADIRITGVSPKQIAEYVEMLMPRGGGIGVYSGFCHVDVREKRSRWKG